MGRHGFLLVLSIAALVTLFAVTNRESKNDIEKLQHETTLLSLDKEAAVSRLQTLKSRISTGDAGKQSISDLRQQLLNLESNLKSELKSVKSLLSGLDDKEGGNVKKNSQEEVIDSASAKKAIQKGVLRGDSVEAQLRNVLDSDLEKLIVHETKWKSKSDLDNAVEFASYLKDHPLESVADRARRTDLSDKSPIVSSQLALKPIPRIAVDGDGLVQAVDTVPQFFRDSGAVPNGVEGAEYAEPTGASTSNDNSGAAQLDDDQAQELASVKERARAVHEALRRRSGFVRLRSGGAFPLPIRPYYG